jgi:hypothetical protein
MDSCAAWSRSRRSLGLFLTPLWVTAATFLAFGYLSSSHTASLISEAPSAFPSRSCLDNNAISLEAGPDRPNTSPILAPLFSAFLWDGVVVCRSFSFAP